MKENCAIIIAAKDSYADTWPAFFELFFKYWSDCPFDIYMLTEGITFEDKRVKSIVLPTSNDIAWDKQWASRMKKVLQISEAQYFIMFHTDYFLSKKVDTQKIIDIFHILKNNPEVGFIRLFPDPPAFSDWKNHKEIGIIKKSDKFSISLQASLWRSDFFLKILRDGWGPADLETKGGLESHLLPELFLGTKKNFPAISYINGIKKGRLQYETVKLFKREGLSLNYKKPIESRLSFLLRKLKINIFLRRLKRLVT